MMGSVGSISSMMTSGSLARKMGAGAGGIAGIESRMKQIDAMLNSLQPNQAITLPPMIPPVQNGQTIQSIQAHQSLNPAGRSQQVGKVSFDAYLDPDMMPHKPVQEAYPFQALVESMAKKHAVDSRLVRAVIQQESGFNPNAISSAGARGLMQLMPETARGLGVEDPEDPTQNLDGGVKYLKSMLTKFHGNIPLALAAYNAGPGAVDRHGGIPPFPETQKYVRAILGNYLEMANAGKSAAMASNPSNPSSNPS